MHQCKHEIHIMANLDELAQTAANDFAQRAIETVERKGVFSVVLSGGTTPVAMFEYLATLKDVGKKSIPWDRIHFFWGDEHFVSPDDPASNFRIANYHLLSKVPVLREHIHPILTNTPSVALAAQGYEKKLRNIFMLEKGEFPVFDLVFLGLGPLGETASLRPNTKIVKEYSNNCAAHNRIVESIDGEKDEISAISMTPPVFNCAHKIMFLVTGQAKAEAFAQVLNNSNNPEACPAKLIKPRDGSILWLVEKSVVSE